MQEVAWALAYAHLRGIVHRDVKPDNILLEQGTGRALVSDFGIARRTDAAGVTSVGEVLGTAQFMSPEQATGEPVDGRSDLYALGVVAFYALSGHLPFDAPDVATLLAMHITRPAPPLAAAAPGVPGALAQAVDRCLAKDPADRFQTGEALASAVEASTESARELPVPLRVWLTKGEGIKMPLRIFTVLAGLTFILPLVVEGHAAWNTLGVIAVPWSLYALYRLYHMQRVLAAGYGLGDLRMTLDQHLQRRREELAFEYDREPSIAGRVIRWIMLASVGTGALAAGGSLLLPAIGALPVVAGAGATVGFSALLLGEAFPGTRRRPRDSWLALRVKLWRGRFGEWLVRLGRVGLKPASLPPAGGHRPTELSIGVAADTLFDALPRRTRQELKDLPTLIRRLQADAQALRARGEELSALLAGAGDEGPAARSAALRPDASPAAGALGRARQQLRDDLAAEREVVTERLATTVAALENIRLDLMRLTAGVGTASQISADLGAARKIEADVDAMLAGHREVEALLAPAQRTSGADRAG
jgi:hypothetical protein